MESIGEHLKRAREAKGLDLASVAALTKITTRYLEAIEADDRKSLPSGFFYKSFIHQYASVIGMDTRQVDAEVERVLAADAPLLLPGQEMATGQTVPQVKAMPSFNRPRAFASIAALMLVVLGCSGIYAWWRKTQTAAAKNIAQVTAPAVVEKTPVTQQPQKQKAVEQPAGSKPVETDAGASQPAEQKAEEQKPAEQKSADLTPATEPEQKVAEATAQPASLESALQTAKNVSASDKPTDTSGHRVVLDLLAREDTWLSVTSDGKRVFTGVLASNHSKTVAGKESAKMIVGNAAGLEVRLNGKSIGPLGEHGQVMVLVFTPDNFQVVSAATPKVGD